MDFLRIFQPGLKPSPCNRHFNFKRISFRTRAEISARLARLEFANVITPNAQSLFSRSAFSRSVFSRHPVNSSQWNCRGKRKLSKGYTNEWCSRCFISLDPIYAWKVPFFLSMLPCGKRGRSERSSMFEGTFA